MLVVVARHFTMQLNKRTSFWSTISSRVTAVSTLQPLPVTLLYTLQLGGGWKRSLHSSWHMGLILQLLTEKEISHLIFQPLCWYVAYSALYIIYWITTVFVNFLCSMRDCCHVIILVFNTCRQLLAYPIFIGWIYFAVLHLTYSCRVISWYTFANSRYELHTLV